MSEDLKHFLIFGGTIIFMAALFVMNQMGIPILVILVVALILMIILAAGWVMPRVRVPLIIVGVFFVLGSGWVILVNDAKHAPAPIQIDNSVNVMPAPTDNAQVQTWLQDKTQIRPDQGAGKVFATGWGVGFTAFLLVFAIGWVIQQMGFKFGVPLELLFFVIWVLVSVFLIASPVNKHNYDQATGNALNLQWWLGFAKNIWYPMLISAFSWVIRLMRVGAQKTGIYAVGMVVAAATWIFIEIFTATIDPTRVSWTMCSNALLTTGVTNALCQEANASGAMAAIAVSMAWGWLVSLIMG